MSNNPERNFAINAAHNCKIHHAQLEDIAKFITEKINHLKRGGIRQGASRNQI